MICASVKASNDSDFERTQEIIIIHHSKHQENHSLLDKFNNALTVHVFFSELEFI